MTIKAELLALSKDAEKLTTATVVDWAAANPQSAIYGALEWDDAIAGRKYREWQVRQLISLCVFDDQGDRSLVSLSIDRAEGGYRRVDEVLKAPDLSAVLLEDAKLALKRVRDRFGRVKALVKIWEAVDEVVGAPPAP
jgi:hypothetical protein